MEIKAQHIFVCSLMFLLSGCTQFFFQPLKQHLASPEQYEINYEDIYFEGEAGKLHGWWFPSQQAVAQPGIQPVMSSTRSSTRLSTRATVLFLHGNGENISTHAGLIYWLTEYQYDVFIFDYRGYGKSEGSAQLAGVLNDISSARRYVESRKGTKKLFVVGHSLGASLAVTNMAMDKASVDGMILVSPFSDFKKITREMMSKSWITWAFQWPISLTINDEYNPLEFVAKLPSVPKLFVYSESDPVISPQHVQRLYAKAEKPKSIERVNGGHNSVFAQTENQQMILNYLNQWSK